MTNHWESSARPLFVKTLFVNGSRHAILSEKDPLLRYNNLKKQNSATGSIYFGSTFSVNSSENQDSSSDRELKNYKFEKIRKHHRKDITSDLQNCLTKLRIASGIINNNETNNRDKEYYDIQHRITKHLNKKNVNYKHKRRKENNGKRLKKKNSLNYLQEVTRNEQNASENRSNCYLFYGLENSKEKENCVKIGSKPSELILNCSKDENVYYSYLQSFFQTKSFYNFEEDNILLSEKFQELISVNNDENPSKYIFSLANPDSQELSLNNFLTSSFFERVIQWVHLSNKRKNKEQTNDEISARSARILAEERFINKNNILLNSKNWSGNSTKKFESKLYNKKMKENIIPNVSQDEDVNTEVKGEINVTTALSVIDDCLQSPEMNSDSNSKDNENIKICDNDLEKNKEECSEKIFTPKKLDSNLSMVIQSQDYVGNGLNRPSSSKRFFKSEKLEQEYYIYDNTKCLYNSSEKQEINTEKFREESKDIPKEQSEERYSNLKISPRNTSWRTRCKEKSTEICKDMYSSNKNSYALINTLRYKNLTQKFVEKTFKSINIHNITQTILNQNLSSPQQQQQQKASWLREKNFFSEKDMGRPQLHIFIPSVPSKDVSEDSEGF